MLTISFASKWMRWSENSNAKIWLFGVVCSQNSMQQYNDSIPESHVSTQESKCSPHTFVGYSDVFGALNYHQMLLWQPNSLKGTSRWWGKCLHGWAEHHASTAAFWDLADCFTQAQLLCLDISAPETLRQWCGFWITRKNYSRSKICMVLNLWELWPTDLWYCKKYART